MMATLLETRDIIKRFYTKYDVYINPVLKFFLALVNFMLISSKIGFMKQLSSPLVVVVLSIICAMLPLNTMVLLAGAVLLAHAYALSLEVCMVMAALVAVMYLLYFRISSKCAILLLLTPFCFMIGIPYVIPLLGGLLFGPAAAVPAGCGAVIYYLINYMSQNATSLGTGEIQTGAMKVASLIESLINNKEMFICVLAMILTVLIVYFIRRQSFNYSREIAIVIGTFGNIVLHLVAALFPGVSIGIIGLLLGSVISAGLAWCVHFFVFSVDYTRVERVQFEDDEYIYYVKAVPKNIIAEPKKTVKKIVTQKKQTRTIKRIDS